MNMRCFVSLLFIAALITSCDKSTTSVPKSAFGSYKQTVTPLGQNLLLTISGDFISSLYVIGSIENVYSLDGIHVIVHTRMPSDKDSDAFKLRLLHTVLISEGVSRVYWGKEMIWQRGDR